MDISPEAKQLTAIWAKRFQPWMWNFHTRTWTEKGKRAPLRTSIEQQFQSFLDRGHTLYDIQHILSWAKEQKLAILHVYPLLAEHLCGILPDEESANLLSDAQNCHPVLFQVNGLRVERWTIEDTARYVYRDITWSLEEWAQCALLTLVRDWGLDVVLFAGDVMRDREFVPYSPWGVVVMQDEAQQRYQRRQSVLQQTRREVRALEELYGTHS